jgi:carbon-monoxide dehydrogenase medium subunit
MKPPPFEYHDPTTIPEAISLLGSYENARLLAGGQSLMPMLNMRYVFPDHLIDLNKVGGLDYINTDADGVEIGGMTRQRDIEFSDELAEHCPLLSEAIRHVGHIQTRNRGTMGGSLAHLDPAAEIPMVCAAMDARIRAQGPNGERTIPIAEFALGFMTTALAPDEMLVSVSLPGWASGHGAGFQEFGRRHGDFAIASAAALIEVGGDGKIARASLTIGGVGPVPVRIEEAEEGLVGEAGSDGVFDTAAEACGELEALDDIHAPASYRQHLAKVLAKRALAQAWERAAS